MHEIKKNSSELFDLGVMTVMLELLKLSPDSWHLLKWIEILQFYMELISRQLKYT